MLQNAIPLWKSKSTPPNNVNKDISNMTPATDIFFLQKSSRYSIFSIIYIFFFTFPYY